MVWTPPRARGEERDLNLFPFDYLSRDVLHMRFNTRIHTSRAEALDAPELDIAFHSLRVVVLSSV